MSCLTEGDVARFVAGDLDEAQRLETEEHMSRCRLCRRRVVELGRASEHDDVLDPQDREQVPEQLKQRVKRLPSS